MYSYSDQCHNYLMDPILELLHTTLDNHHHYFMGQFVGGTSILSGSSAGNGAFQSTPYRLASSYNDIKVLINCYRGSAIIDSLAAS